MKRGKRLLAILLAVMLAVGAAEMPVAAGEADSEVTTVEADTSDQTAAADDSDNAPADETTAADGEKQEASDDAATDTVDDTMSEDSLDEGSDQKNPSEDPSTEKPDSGNDVQDGATPDIQDDSNDSGSQDVPADNEQQAGVDDNADGETYGTGGRDFEENQSDSVEESTSSENALEEDEEQPALLTPEQIRAFQENIKVWKHENQITVIYDSNEVVKLGYSIYSGLNDELLYSGNLVWDEQSDLYLETIDFDAMNETREAEDENAEEISIRDIPLKIVVDDGSNQFEESVSSDSGVTSIDIENDTEGRIDLLCESSIDDLNGYSVLVRDKKDLDVHVIETTENSMSFYTSEVDDAVFEVAAYMYDDNTGIKQYFQSVSYDYAASTLEEPVADDGNGEDAKEEQDDESSMDSENADNPQNAQDTNEEASESGETDRHVLVADSLTKGATGSSEAMGAASFSQTMYNGHMYQLFNEGVSWSTAKSRCEAKGGHLVTITSSGEYSFCKSLLGDLSPKYCWLGATHASGSWKWVTGEPWSFTAWSPNQPNGSGGGTYALMQNFEGVGSAWNWDDQGDSGTSPSTKYQGAPYYHLTKNYCYICEWEEKVSGLIDNTDDYQRASRKISIKWDGLSSSETRYQIQYSTDRYFIQNVITDTVNCAGTGSYTTEELERLKKYFFRVRVNNYYPGIWSDVISVNTCNSLLAKELWGFNNHSDSIDLSYFKYTLPYANAIDNSKNSGNGEQGVCNGMCIVASLMMTYNADLNVRAYGEENLNNLKYTRSIREFIRYAQAWSTRRYLGEDFLFCNTHSVVEEYQNGNEESHLPIIVLTQINKNGDKRTAEHAVIGLAFIEISDTEALIKIYDPNYKGDEERYIRLSIDENMKEKGPKWEYKSDFFTTFSGYFGNDSDTIIKSLTSHKYENGSYNDLIFCSTVLPGRFWHDYQNSLATANVEGIEDEMSYTGNELEQSFTVTVENRILIKDHDYTVKYEDNKTTGEAKIIINGIGNYYGCIVRTFNIVKKSSQSITVKSSATSIAVGKTATVSISGAKGTKSYKSSDPSIAAVNATTGVVTGKKPGTVTITATSAATSKYYEASGIVTITVNLVLKKPGNCHFAKWNNAKYTSCQIAWNKVAGAEGYQTLLSWTNGTHASSTITKSNVLYRNCTVHPQHVSQMKVRAFYTAGGKRVFGPWSNVEYITPSPAKLTTKNASSGSNLKMNISWNIIYGCNGYNVFITTNPNGTWYWNQSTPTKADATSAVITKYRGSSLKKNTRYYVRIVTRRKRNGVFCTVPMPAKNTYVGSFIIK